MEETCKKQGQEIASCLLGCTGASFAGNLVLEPQNLYLGDLGVDFGTLGVILVTRGSPGGSTGDPLEPEVFFCQFLLDLGFLLGTTSGSFW